MSTTIERTDDPKHNPFTIRDKRLYLPFKISAVCPHCGQTIVKDCAVDYFAYIIIGAPIILDFYHEFEGPNNSLEEWAEHEFSIQVVLDVTLTIAPDKEA